MSRYNIGDMVQLCSDSTIDGAVIRVIPGGKETRYQVFTSSSGKQIYYESQLELKVEDEVLEFVDTAMFHARITAALLKNPTISSLYSINSAKIDYIPHQYRPVLKLVHSDRPRMLIADGVGVGKTIEAGLILQELKARQNIDSVLIICPRPLITERKWELEMKRFGEDFTALDGDLFRYCLKETDLDQSWPNKFNHAIIPYSLFTEENIDGKETSRRKKPALMQLDTPPHFDLVIVDEAHHIRNTATYAYRAVKQFCDNAEAVLFLTATPVQLEYDDLFVMLNLLRPDIILDKETFHNMAEPNEFINLSASIVRSQCTGWQEKAFNALQTACKSTEWGKLVLTSNPTVQRALFVLKQGNIDDNQRVQLISDIESLHTFSNIISRTRRRDIGNFTVRKATTVSVPFTPEQKALHDSILNIIHKMLSEIHCTENTKFMMTTIRRQTASCLFGLTPMLESILTRHYHELVDDDYLESELSGNDADAVQLKRAINQIITLAQALPEDDPKLESLFKIIVDKQKADNNKIMIFSSFRHTLNYLNTKLKSKGLRVGLIHGGVDDDTRRSLREQFELPKENKVAIDIMLFSEVGCEGLDYQFCDCMVNYDLPWNPMRVEQRIGRIDRNGQQSENVAIFNMITPGTVDFDIYNRCMARIGVFQQSIGDCEEILGSMASEIRNIAENFTLTEEEKQCRLQQLTDNRIRKIQEQAFMEEQEKNLFSINAPNSYYNEEVKNATNIWLLPDMLQNLVTVYLQGLLDSNTTFILGESARKTLRLSQEARETLLNHYLSCGMQRNAANRKWEKWLRSGDYLLPITFDPKEARKNEQLNFITLTHPLVQQAVDYIEDENDIMVEFRFCSDQYERGCYPFALYQWSIIGERDDTRIMPICADVAINDALPAILCQSEQYDADVIVPEEYWDAIECIHHDIWEQAQEEHRLETKELVQFKLGSLTTSYNARRVFLEEQLEKATSAKIIKMREAELRNAEADYLTLYHNLQAAENKVDILSERLARGVLIIEPVSLDK